MTNSRAWKTSTSPSDFFAMSAATGTALAECSEPSTASKTFSNTCPTSCAFEPALRLPSAGPDRHGRSGRRRCPGPNGRLRAGPSAAASAGDAPYARDMRATAGRVPTGERLARARRAYAATAGNPRAVAATTAAGIAAGAAAWLAGQHALASLAWTLATGLALVPLAVSVIRDLLRRRPGVDLIALLAMTVALALGQALAGAVVALMLSGGLALEAYADARARRELSALLARAPRAVHRHAGGRLEVVPVEEVRRGDLLLVGPGEVVAVDGLATAPAVLDESALTGESRPVAHDPGTLVRSGCVNAGVPFDLRAVTTAEASTYAGVVRLVREAQAGKAPFVRLADRYALLFLPLTLAVAAGAWLASGDPVRALAVLVVATPCPLILAAPVAIVAGISREARRGLIVKGGGALETLARARVVVLDKTGTLTA